MWLMKADPGLNLAASSQESAWLGEAVMYESGGRLIFLQVHGSQSNETGKLPAH